MKDESAARFSVSLSPNLLRDLDRMTEEKGYDNRSLAIADMIRAELVEHRQERRSGEIAGTITIVYDHHIRRVQELLTDLQHDHPNLVVATMHVHLDHDHCLEVLVARGKATSIKKMADKLIGAKGVKHGRLTITSTGKDLPG